MPETASPEARAFFDTAFKARGDRRASLPDRATLERHYHAGRNAPDGPLAADTLPAECADMQVHRRRLAGVPVLDIKRDQVVLDPPTLIYFHGGAYAFGSPLDGLAALCRLSRDAGSNALSVDYTTAPFARWPAMTREALDVVLARVGEGVPLARIALVGDSAGAGLALATALRLRDERQAAVAAVVVWSPWSDLTQAGDTAVTLADADPMLDKALLLRPAALLYADVSDQRHPYVSPVYADFSQGFPPTLIQAGTKEIFLSDAVRLYQAIATVPGGVATLDLYEGMPHVFQLQTTIPESQLALARAARFLRQAFALPTLVP